MTLILLNSTIILTVDNVFRRFCACGGRIATGTTSNWKQFLFVKISFELKSFYLFVLLIYKQA